MPSITEFVIVLVCIAKAGLLVVGSASSVYLTGRAAGVMLGRWHANDPALTRSRRSRDG